MVEASWTTPTAPSPGAWLGPLSEAESTVPFPMELEAASGGSPAAAVRSHRPAVVVRAAVPPGLALLLRPSATVLVPEPVFVPRGRQFASTLVNGLLAGPVAELADTSPTTSPPASAPWSRCRCRQRGAEVDLTSDTRGRPLPASTRPSCWSRSSPGRCARTPSIARFRGHHRRPAGAAARRDGVQRRARPRYAPYVAGRARQLFGLQDGVMVGGSPRNLGDRRPGRSARPTTACARSPRPAGRQVAGVSRPAAAAGSPRSRTTTCRHGLIADRRGTCSARRGTSAAACGRWTAARRVRW